jgi:hypothetical protein
MDFVSNGTPTSNQTEGDCQQNVCDGAGHIISVTDNTDIPSPYYDTPCVDSICTNGVPSHPFLAAGTDCIGGGGICDGAGNCVQCLDNSMCPPSGVPNTVTICDSGHCSYQCIDGYTECIPNGGGCVDTSSDLAHCGACNQPCSVNNGIGVCNNGVCGIEACNAGFDDCNAIAADGCEVDVQNDPENCGVCNNVCPPIPHGAAICANGACGIGACDAGWDHCDMEGPVGCETPLGTNENCSSCGDVCQDGTTCLSGGCA